MVYCTVFWNLCSESQIYILTSTVTILPKEQAPSIQPFYFLNHHSSFSSPLDMGDALTQGLSLYLVSLCTLFFGNLIYSHRRGLQTLLTLTHLSAPALLTDLSSLICTTSISNCMFKIKPWFSLSFSHTLTHLPTHHGGEGRQSVLFLIPLI